MTDTYWRGRRVFVTGAAGFIGSHLVERLVAEGARVRALVRYTSSGGRGWLQQAAAASSVEFVASDVCDPGVIGQAMEGQDTVFHLAALIGIPYSYVAPQSYVQTNVVGTATMLKAALDQKIRRFVHTSTSEVYGTARAVPITEDHPLQTQSPYSASKAAADLLAWSYQRSFGLDVAIVRPFNTFGPRQSMRAVIPTIVSQVLAKSDVALGHLDPTRDFTYVADTVDGFLRIGAADAAVGQVVNIGSGKEISIRDLAALIQELAGTRLPLAVDATRERPAASEVDRLCADNARARQLGWTPRTSLREGLLLTIAWIKDHREHFEADAYRI